MYLLLERLSAVGEPARVGLYGTYAMVIKFVDRSGDDGTEGGRNGGSEGLDGVQAILPCVMFRGAPEPLDEVQLAMKLRVENY